MRYFQARFEQEQESSAFRIYLTDALKVLSENTARFGGGSSMRLRYAEIIDRTPPDTRTPEEVIGNIKNKLSKLGGGKN